MRPESGVETEAETETKKWSRDHAGLETLTSLGPGRSFGRKKHLCTVFLIKNASGSNDFASFIEHQVGT